MSEYTEAPYELSRYINADGTTPTTKEELKAILCESIDKSPGLELFGVAAKRDGENVVLCYTGNGPKSLANAERIIDALEALSSSDSWLKREKAKVLREFAKESHGLCDGCESEASSRAAALEAEVKP